MSRYLQLNNDEPSFLASNAGWQQFIDWFDAAPEESRAECPNLNALIETGTCDDPAACNEELSQLSSAHEADDDVSGIIETLMETFSATSADDEIAITA